MFFFDPLLKLKAEAKELWTLMLHRRTISGQLVRANSLNHNSCKGLILCLSLQRYFGI